MIINLVTQAEENIKKLNPTYPSGVCETIPTATFKLHKDLHIIEFNSMYPHITVQLYDNLFFPDEFYDNKENQNDINKIRDFIFNIKEYKQTLSQQEYYNHRVFVNSYFTKLYKQHRYMTLLICEYTRAFYEQLLRETLTRDVRHHYNNPNEPNILYIDTDMLICKEITPTITNLINKLNIPYCTDKLSHFYIKSGKRYIYMTQDGNITHKGLSSSKDPNGHKELESIIIQDNRNKKLNELLEIESD